MKRTVFGAIIVSMVGLMTVSVSANALAQQRHVLEMNDQLITGNTQIGLKQEANRRGINLRNQELLQVIVVSKSRNGQGSVRLLDGQSRALTIPGTPDRFNDRSAFTFSRLSLDADATTRNTPWRLQFNGQIKVRQIVLLTSRGSERGLEELDFGGMYGSGTNSASRYIEYRNPLTGAMSCPQGFRVVQASGVHNKDYSSYYCVRALAPGQPRTLLFGGMYGGGEGSVYRYPNPVTGASNCPAGYIAQTIKGAHNVDWNQTYCYKQPSNRFEQSVLPFGGIIGTRPNGAGGVAYYPNPITGTKDCPVGYRRHSIYGSDSVDWGMGLCVPI